MRNTEDQAQPLFDEPGRLRALQRYAIVDSAREPQFDTLVELVRDVLDAPASLITLIDADRMWSKAAAGADNAACARGISFCDHTIRSGSVLVVPDATADPRFARNPHVTGAPFVRSYAGVPLPTPDGYNLGALCVIDQRPREFTPRQVRLLSGFARMTSELIELRTLAHRDFLTGALTRRAFSAELESALAAQARNGREAMLVTFDLDHFKRINDRLGHGAGDMVLKAVASACSGALRPRQRLGRLGGEEFAVLIEDAGVIEALACAERLRRIIEGLEGPGGETLSASFGIARLGREATIDQWLKDADRAMYAAKQAGRNRCVVAPTAEPGMRAA